MAAQQDPKRPAVGQHGVPRGQTNPQEPPAPASAETSGPAPSFLDDEASTKFAARPPDHSGSGMAHEPVRPPVGAGGGRGVGGGAARAGRGELSVGARLGDYTITGILGRGGMGIVYEASHPLVRRRVALKILPPDLAADAEAVARFQREGKTAAKVDHDNVVRVLDIGDARVESGSTAGDIVHYMTMELVKGGTAKEYIEARGAMNWPEAVRVIADACRGLAAAHATGMIHRDIKPANIMRSTEGVVKLADFGLAKTSDRSHTSITTAGSVVGTPQYMSPEQCMAQTLDARSDVYSMGATLYALLTGKPPFSAAGTTPQIMFAHCYQPVPDPRTAAAEAADAGNPGESTTQLRAAAIAAIPQRVVDIVMRAMAKAPDERFQTAAEMAAVLDAVLEAPTAATGADVGEPGLSASGVGCEDRLETRNPRLETGGAAGDWGDFLAAGDRLRAARMVEIAGSGDAIATVRRGEAPSRTGKAVSGRSVPSALGQEGHRPEDRGERYVGGAAGGQPKSANRKLKTASSPTGPFAALAAAAVVALAVGAWLVLRDPGPKPYTPRPPTDDGGIAKPGPIADGGTKPIAKTTPVEPPPTILDLGGGVRMELVTIKPGAFTMGSTEAPKQGRQVDERPEHQVRITKGYYLGKTEVTRGQFAAFVKATGYKTEAEKKGKAWVRQTNGAWEEIAGANWKDPVVFKQTDEHPAMCICWNDAKAFCEWASKKAGRSVRLPTEAEWEYACRAGTKTRWYFGDNEASAVEHGWTNANSGWQTQPVGQKKSNPWGLYDMYGNVWEWCEDWAGPYAAGDMVDPTGPAGGNARCLRGGGWSDNAIECRSALRHSHTPSSRGTNLGFRVAVTAEPGAAGTPPVTTTVKPVDEAWIKSVQALPAEEQVKAVEAKLRDLNPGFVEEVKSRIENGAVIELGWSSPAVRDLSPVRALSGLRGLECKSPWGKGVLTNLSPLRGLPLEWFVCDGTQVADLSPLAGMPLKRLLCAGTPVSDLSPLRGMKLEHLECHNTRVADLAPLAGMPLQRLRLGYTQVTDLSPLKDMPLRTLECRGTKVADLSPLRGMPLEELDCLDMSNLDLSILKGIPIKRLWHNIRPAVDAELLRSITSLQTLNGRPVEGVLKDLAETRPIIRWRLLGPFQRGTTPPFDPTAAGGALTDDDFKKSYTGVAGAPVGWSAAEVDKDGKIDLLPLMKPNTNTTVFAYAFVASPAARDVELLVGSDDTVAIWLNGKKIWDNPMLRPWSFADDRVPARLNAGVNHILVRCENAEDKWMFSVRVPSDLQPPVDP